jgi:hypothetical protein
MQLKEAGHINTSLLALGSVITALSDNATSAQGQQQSQRHVPFRNSKLTRLLRAPLSVSIHAFESFLFCFVFFALRSLRQSCRFECRRR